MQVEVRMGDLRASPNALSRRDAERPRNSRASHTIFVSAIIVRRCTVGS